jgi:hypothetical protein
VAGTTTGDDQLNGTETEIGAKTLLAGIDSTTIDGTELGTFPNETTANDGDDGKVSTYDDGKFSTHDNGTATGETQVDGTKTTDGA